MLNSSANIACVIGIKKKNPTKRYFIGLNCQNDNPKRNQELILFTKLDQIANIPIIELVPHHSNSRGKIITFNMILHIHFQS
jgi:hypothetical protein